jgi:hypothetical protein
VEFENAIVGAHREHSRSPYSLCRAEQQFWIRDFGTLLKFAGAFGLPEEKANQQDSITISLSVQIYCGELLTREGFALFKIRHGPK